VWEMGNDKHPSEFRVRSSDSRHHPPVAQCRARLKSHRPCPVFQRKESSALRRDRVRNSRRCLLRSKQFRHIREP